MTRLMDRPDTQAIAQARERYARRRRRRRALLGCLTAVALIAALVLAAGLTVAKPLWMTEDGMSPTLEAGTLVLYNGCLLYTSLLPSPRPSPPRSPRQSPRPTLEMNLRRPLLWFPLPLRLK